jgi:hypothetical protein
MLETVIDALDVSYVDLFAALTKPRRSEDV